MSSTDDYAETFSAFLAAESDDYVTNKAAEHYEKHEFAYQTHGVDLFGVRRNVFLDKYEALASKWRGGQEESAQGDQVGRAGPEGPATLHRPWREWGAWKSKEACEVLKSQRIRQEKPDW